MTYGILLITSRLLHLHMTIRRPKQKQSGLLAGTASMTLSQVFLLGTGYLVQIVLASFLPPSTYGLFGILLATLNLGELVFSRGILRNVTSLIARDPSQAARIIRRGQHVQYVAIAGVSIVFLLFADQIARQLHAPELTGYLRALALMFPLYGIRAFYASVLSGFKLFHRQALHRFVAGLLKLLAIPAMLLWHDLYAVLAAYFLSAVYLLYTYRAEAKRWPNYTSGEGIYPLRPFLAAMIPLLAYVSLLPFLQSFDLYLLKALIPDAATLAGYYAGAASLAKIPLILLSSLSVTLLPSLARTMLAGQTAQLRVYHDKSDGLLLVTLLPAVLLPISFSGDLIDFFLPSAYRTASFVLILLLGSAAASVFLEKSLLYFVAASRYRTLLGLVLPILPVYLLALFFFVPRFGMEGAAGAALCVALLAAVCVRFVIWNIFHLPFPFVRFIHIALCAGIPAILGFFLPFSGSWVILKGLILSGLYVLLLFAFRALTEEERRYPSRLLVPLVKRLRSSLPSRLP